MLVDPAPSSPFALDLTQRPPRLYGPTAAQRLRYSIAHVVLFAAPADLALRKFIEVAIGGATLVSLAPYALFDLALFLVAVVALGRAGWVEFGETGVTRRPLSRLLGPTRFTPYDVYEGLAYRRKEVGGDIVTTVSLVGVNPADTLTIFQTRSDAWRETFALYVDWFDAPIVVAAENGQWRRVAAEDVGAPIRTLVERGVLPAPSAAPPPLVPMPLVGWRFPAAVLAVTAALTAMSVYAHATIEVTSGPSVLAVVSGPIVLLALVGVGLLWWERTRRRWAAIHDDVLKLGRPRATFSWFRSRRDPIRLDEITSVSVRTIGSGALGLGFLHVGTPDGAASLVLSAKDTLWARDTLYAAAAQPKTASQSV